MFSFLSCGYRCYLATLVLVFFLVSFPSPLTSVQPSVLILHLSSYSSVVSFTQCSPTCGRMPLPALSLWPGRRCCSAASACMGRHRACVSWTTPSCCCGACILIRPESAMLYGVLVPSQSCCGTRQFGW